MAEHTNVEVWGNNFSQTSSTFTISKTDLQAKLQAAGITYTPTSSDNAEKLLTALIQVAALTLNATDRATDYLNRNVEIALATPSITTQGGSTWQIDTYTARLYKLFTNTNPSPDNY